MQENIYDLIKKFDEIKSQGLHKSIRKGKYGIGDTFESLLGKEFDKSYLPDYKNIEVKTKFGYTKSPLTLFSLTPQSKEEYTIKYLVDEFGYPESSFSKFNVLRAEAQKDSEVLVSKKYYFDLFVDWDSCKLRLLIKNKNQEVISDDIYWPFEELKKRLEIKLQYLALVIGYPYKINGDYYYKFFKMSVYKLRSFKHFLELIDKKSIKIVFNVGIYRDEEKYGAIKDRGTAFKLETSDIYKLFEKIY